MNHINLSLESVSKFFATKKVIDNFSYHFTSGCYAVVGQNGVGKSTLLSIMAGSTLFDRGVININGINLAKYPVKAKKHISYVPDGVLVYPFMTGEDLLKFIAAAKKSEISRETMGLLTGFGLLNFMKMAFNDMSLGTQRKFMLAAASIGDPDIYILDEPTNAIDQLSREILLNYLLGIKDKKIVLCSTHDNDLINILNPRILRL